MSSDSGKASVPRAKRATVKDVARAASVSPMTVSNVLNNRLQFVSTETKARVEREIERLNYRRQAAARSLRAAEQHSIGMIIIDESPNFLADFFTTQVVAGLANALNQADYTMTVQGMASSALKQSMIMRNFEVGGFCAMLSGNLNEREGVLDQLRSLDQPLVLFQEQLTSDYQDICTVRQADRDGGRLIGDHLLARGVEDIVMVKPARDWPAIDNRIAGLKDAIAAAPRRPTLSIIEAQNETFSESQAALNSYLQFNSTPGAVVGANDRIAQAAMLLLMDQGHNVPDDVRVIGFNGFEAHRYLRPRLTTIVSSAYELGDRAGKAMLDRLKSGAFAEPDLVLPVYLDQGETT